MKAFYKNLKEELKICMVAGYTQLICTKLQNKRNLIALKTKRAQKTSLSLHGQDCKIVHVEFI